MVPAPFRKANANDREGPITLPSFVPTISCAELIPIGSRATQVRAELIQNCTALATRRNVPIPTAIFRNDLK